MTDAINSSNLWLDATQYRLMAEVATGMELVARFLFWKTLPDTIPDLKIYLPALTVAVERETDPLALRWLSSCPLPDTLSPETAGWRQRLVTAWEKQLTQGLSSVYGCIRTCIYSLGGLTQVDKCGMPPGMTCRSVLPTLLNAAHYIKQHKGSDPYEYKQFTYLAVLADWRPAPNVITAPAILKAWGDFWLELYQKGLAGIRHNGDAAISLKGIAAKALLNLMEAGGEKETGIPADMKMFLLESLTMAIDIAGETDCNNCHLDWLNWQPGDVNRFPTVQLVRLPETLLKKVRLLCQKTEGWEDQKNWEDRTLPRILSDALGQLVRWERTGLPASCRIHLMSCVLTDVSDYLDNCMRRGIPSATFMNSTLPRWLIRPEVAAFKKGRELIQKLENYWQYECTQFKSSFHNRPSPNFAWQGLMQLQRTGLATKTPVAFHRFLLKAVEKEQAESVVVVLSSWRPAKTTADGKGGKWDGLWQERLKSDNDDLSRAAALALLRPNPGDDLVARQQKLRNVLCALPEKIRPKLSVAEITHLMKALGELPFARCGMDIGQKWQFESDAGMRFRVPMERTAPVSTPTTVGTIRPDRTLQITAK